MTQGLDCGKVILFNLHKVGLLTIALYFEIKARTEVIYDSYKIKFNDTLILNIH